MMYSTRPIFHNRKEIRSHTKREKTYLLPHEKRILTILFAIVLTFTSFMAGAAFVITQAKMTYEPITEEIIIDLGNDLQFIHYVGTKY